MEWHKASTKELWQMTLVEFQKTTRTKWNPEDKATIVVLSDDEAPVLTGYYDPVGAKRHIHRIEVSYALAKGKPVPVEVLRDYPDLAKHYSKKKYHNSIKK